MSAPRYGVRVGSGTSGRLLACPPLHPRLSRWSRQAILEAVLRRAPFEAFTLAAQEWAELERDSAPGAGIVDLATLMAQLPDEPDDFTRPRRAKPVLPEWAQKIQESA